MLDQHPPTSAALHRRQCARVHTHPIHFVALHPLYDAMGDVRAFITHSHMRCARNMSARVQLRHHQKSLWFASFASPFLATIDTTSSSLTPPPLRHTRRPYPASLPPPLPSPTHIVFPENGREINISLAWLLCGDSVHI